MLTTSPNLDDPDRLYAALVDAHRDLTPEQSRLLDARLVLLLANQIGRVDVVLAALEQAKG